MSTAKEHSKVARYWWLALLGLCLVPCVTPFTCGHDPRRAIAGIPVGSKLSELDKHLGRFYNSASVLEWVSDRTADSTKKPVKSKYGSFNVRDLGEYEGWTASKAARDSFTGEIDFFHYIWWIIPDDIAPSYMVCLFYVDGVLKEKELRYLPG